MTDNRNQDEEGEGGNGSAGNAGTGQSLTPNFSGRVNDDERQADPAPPPEEEPPIANKESHPCEGTAYEPHIGDFDDLDELPNGFFLGFHDGVWYLFDDDKKFIGAFTDREAAVDKAREMKPFPKFGI